MPGTHRPKTRTREPAAERRLLNPANWICLFRQMNTAPRVIKPDTTYELVGPKVQRNTENLDRHRLIHHADPALHLDPTAIDLKEATAAEAFAQLDRYLEATPIEGIVWHHPDGRMAKTKRRDFGHVWPLPLTRPTR